MLLNDFKEVINIDNKISSLHSQLDGLYRRRARLVGTNITNKSKYARLATTPFENIGLPAHETDSSDTTSVITPQGWANKTYDELQTTWSAIGITIPNQKLLINRLKKACETVIAIATVEPVIGNDMRVVLVPPTQIMKVPAQAKLRSHQPFVDEDYIQPEIKPSTDRSWKVLLIYTQPEGLLIGDARTILNKKLYKLAGHDARDLGVREYIALTLQQPIAIDSKNWTLLFKDKAPANHAVGAKYLNGRYRIELIEAEDVFGDVTFRPAIEVR